MSIKAFLAVSAAFLLSGMASAHEYRAGELHIDHPWSRAMPPVSPTGAAYLIIENQGSRADRLLGAETPAAAYTELHEHVHADGLMKMQQIEQVVVEPGQRISFEPGGYHIMLFNLQQPLVAGERFPLTLRFEHAGEIEVEVAVEDQDGPSHGHEHGHGNGHHHH